MNALESSKLLDNNHIDSLVSVITPSYNSSRYIGEAIQSVLAQTYTNWEMIIVDDCSVDHSLEIIHGFVQKDSRIKVLSTETNMGAAAARNKAIEHAKGRYIAFLDSDDQWFPEKLEKQLRFMQDNDYSFSFSNYTIMDEDGHSTEKVVHVPESIDYKGLLKNTIIGCLTVMLDTEKISPIRMPEIRTRQDFALWLNILKRGHIAFGIPEVLAKYRVGKGSISSNKLKAAKRNWAIYREMEGLGFFYSTWCFMNYVYNAVKKRL